MMAGVSTTIYYKEMHDVIKSVLSDRSAYILVACSPDDDAAIYGYIVAQGVGAALVFHWVYVKHPLRNFGVGRNLELAVKTHVPHESIAYTLRTKLTDILTRKDAYVFNPFILWKK